MILLSKTVIINLYSIYKKKGKLFMSLRSQGYQFSQSHYHSNHDKMLRKNKSQMRDISAGKIDTPQTHRVYGKFGDLKPDNYNFESYEKAFKFFQACDKAVLTNQNNEVLKKK